VTAQAVTEFANLVAGPAFEVILFWRVAGDQLEVLGQRELTLGE